MQKTGNYSIFKNLMSDIYNTQFFYYPSRRVFKDLAQLWCLQREHS